MRCQDEVANHNYQLPTHGWRADKPSIYTGQELQVLAPTSTAWDGFVITITGLWSEWEGSGGSVERWCIYITLKTFQLKTDSLLTAVYLV